MCFVADHMNLPVFPCGRSLVMEKEVVVLTVDSSTDSDDVECIIQNSTDFKDSVDKNCSSGNNSSWSDSESDGESGAKCVK